MLQPSITEFSTRGAAYRLDAISMGDMSSQEASRKLPFNAAFHSMRGLSWSKAREMREAGAGKVLLNSTHAT